MGAPARWRSSNRDCAEDLKEAGWGVIPDRF